MTEEIVNEIKKLWEKDKIPKIEIQKKVLQVFIEYFSEALVDSDLISYEEIVRRLDGVVTEDTYKNKGLPYLITMCNSDVNSWLVVTIRFPRVTVTNEHNNSIDITELYAKVNIDCNFCEPIVLRMMRTEYSLEQWASGYSHSHISGLCSDSSDWKNPCLGSGPLVTTRNKITIPNITIDERLEYLGLFCYELDKYVRVESIEGIPYNHLESVGLGDNKIILGNNVADWYYFRGTTKLMLEDFYKYFTSEYDFKFSYINGQYIVGESLPRLLIKMSQYFAAWYNKEGYNKYKKSLEDLTSQLTSQILVKYKISNEQIYTEGRRVTQEYIDDINAENREMLVFKGKPVILRIYGSAKSSSELYLLNDNIFDLFYNRILTTVNYEYRNKEEGETSPDKKFKII